MSVSETFNINCECEQWTSECKLCQAMGFPSGSAVKNLPARAWCTGRPRGVGWRGRWEGVPGWGTHVNTWLIHVNVWQKPLQYCEVISLQLIKKKKKKKESTCNAGDMSSIPGLVRFHGKGKGNPFQYSCLGNSKDREA